MKLQAFSVHKELTNRSDYTEKEKEAYRDVLKLAHVLYFDIKNWTLQEFKNEEVLKKVGWLEYTNTQLRKVADESKDKKKGDDVIGEVIKQITTGKGQTLSRMFERNGLSNSGIEFSMLEARKKIIEAKKAQKEAEDALAAIFKIIEKNKDNYTMDSFTKEVYDKTE